MTRAGMQRTISFAGNDAINDCYVASLRESSVVLGAAAGWLLLHERLGRARLASALVVAAGLVLLVASR